MAAYAAVVSLMNNIDQIMIHPHLSTSFDNKYIQPLVEKAGFLLDFIEGCFNHGGGSNKEDLERRITSAAYAAEDVIESHIVDQILSGTSEVSLRCSLQLQQIIQDIDALIKDANEEKGGWSKQEKSTHTAAAEPLIESGETTGMVGLDDELSKLLHEITWDQSSRRILSIVGMGGTGKTTLATNIYQHALVNQHFDIHAWATISQRYDAKEILSKLLSAIETKSSSETSDSLGDKLHKILIGRKYLIVLDDLWSVEAWDEVRRFFPAQNGSRVLLTTRLTSVATDCGSSFDLKLDLLDEDRSWKLFCHKASFFPQKDDPLQLEDVGKEIVESCKGLALSIAVTGGLLLKSPRTLEYWKSVAKDMKSIGDSKEKQEILDALCLSYSHLPPHLKPCFLYMGVFEEDSEIRVSKVIKLWVAEGFIKPPNAYRELEEVAEGYIKDLIDRNLILVCRRSSSGKIKSCGFHDLLRDLSFKIANQEKLFHKAYYMMQGSYRRIIDPGFTNPTKFPVVRSIIGRRSWPLDKHRLLRVFDEAFYGTEHSFENVVNLRYLAFYSSHRNTHKIPASFSLLWNLQSLIIDLGTTKVIVMPDEFWMMRQLKHVKCRRIYLPNPRKDEVLMLDKLQTLKGAVNLMLREDACNIISSTKRLYLSYHSSFYGYNDSFCKYLPNADRLHELESLKMSFESAKKKDCLKRYLIYELRFPSSLKKLSLERCGLCWKFMEEIGSLPHLEVLKLESFSFMGYQWRPVNDQFLRLKFLKIKHCDLYYWDAESSHFPALEKLLLIDVQGLKEIPSSFEDLGTLQLIHVERCSEDATVSAVRIKERRMENDPSDALLIQVEVKDFELESFMERLKMEKLTVENIRFKVRLLSS